MIKNIYILILLRILFIIATSFAIFKFFNSKYTITFFTFIVLLFFQVILFINHIKQLFIDVEKTVDCLLNDDFSIAISKEKRKTSIYNKTALLIEKNKKTTFLKESEQLIFTNILESLSIGILILRKDTNQQIEVFQLNKIFVQFLRIPKLYKWELLQQKIQPVLNIIDHSDWKIMKQVISISIDDEIEETFHIKTSVTKTYNYEYLTISLETIQQLIDKKEKESWYKLMNVMSHEIINTITPISSLAESLESLIDDRITNKENLDELSQGLKIIKRRSEHLTSFVNSYRKLTELPLPKLEDVNLSDIVNNVISLFQNELLNKKIKISFTSSNIFVIRCDKQQIEQVLINLISNSIYALENSNKPTISIFINREEKRTHLIVEDNGLGIPNAIKPNIFVPYFTTRKKGSGIGLTLSKSIMEAHHGNIQHKAIENKTLFKLSFIN